MTTLYIIGAILFFIAGVRTAWLSVDQEFSSRPPKNQGLYLVLTIVYIAMAVVLIMRPIYLHTEKQQAIQSKQHDAIENEWDTYNVTGIRPNIVRGDDHFFIKHKDGSVYSIHAPYDEQTDTVTVDHIIDIDDNMALYDEYEASTEDTK